MVLSMNDMFVVAAGQEPGGDRGLGEMLAEQYQVLQTNEQEFEPILSWPFFSS